MKSKEKILEDLAGILSNFQGREYSGEIGRHTLFFADLGFASIDAVVLGEALETYYEQQIPFNLIMAEVGRQNVDDIEVGQLADFLHQHLV